MAQQKLFVATECARNVLLEECGPDADSFQDFLNRSKNEIQKLRNKRVLKQDQYEVLFPKDGTKSNINNYDVTLIALLYRLSGKKRYQKDFEMLQRVRNVINHPGLGQISRYNESTKYIDDFVDSFGTDDQKQRMSSAILTHPFDACEIKRSLSNIANEDSLDSGVMFKLEPPLDSYIDRELHLHSKMSEGKPVVVTGLGGCGKSELVRYYCKNNADKYDRNILWIDSNSQESIKSSFNDHINYVKPDCTSVDGTDFEKLASILFSFFIDNNKRFLVVFDDVCEKEDIEPFLPLRSDGHAFTIMTSQIGEWGERYVKIKLNSSFGKKKGLQMVQRQLGGYGNGYGHCNEMELLCETLGNYPLALQQAVAYIRRNRRTIPEYLEMFEKSNKMLDERSLDDKYTKTVSTAWEMAFFKLEKHDLAVDLISVMAYMDGSCIERSFFENGELCDMEQLDGALGDLKAYCLVRFDDDNIAFNCRIIMHKMVQVVVRRNVYRKAGKNYPLLFLRLLKKVILRTNVGKEYCYFWQKHLHSVISSVKEEDKDAFFAELRELFNELKGSDENAMRVKAILNQYLLNVVETSCCQTSINTLKEYCAVL